MGGWVCEGGKLIVCLDKYFRYASSDCMLQKIQIRQCTEDGFVGSGDNTTLRYQIDILLY